MRPTARVPSEQLLARWAPLAPVEPGAAVRVHHSADVFALWRAWEDEVGARQGVPYWAVPWPAAIAFCRLFATDPARVRGRVVLEIGCGGAAAALAASLAGAARVIANDTDPIALHVARLNAAANGITLEFDDRNQASTGLDESAAVILVADLFYERAPAARLLEALRQAAGRGIEVLVADAGRPFAPRSGVALLATETVTVNDDLEGTSQRTVRLLRLLPPE